MAVFRKLKNIFGFSDEEYDQETENEEPEEKTPYINPFKKPVEENQPINNTPVQDKTKEFETSLNTEVTSKIIEVLNSGLPDFIKGCVDIEAERAYIQNIFGDVLKQYSADLKIQMDANAKSQWQSDRINLENEIAKQKQQISESTDKYAELKQRNMSLDRQRVASNERISQLENKVATAEAERDQYELEAKSLLNKLKVSSVNENNLTALKDENANLQTENTNLRAEMLKMKNTAMATPAEDSEETKKKIEELNDQLSQSTAKINALNAQLAQLNEDIANDKSADVITELKAQNENLTAKLNAANEANANASAESQEEANKTIEELKTQLAQATAKIDTLNAQLNELNEEKRNDNNTEIIADLQKQIGQLTDELYKAKEEKNAIKESVSSDKVKVEELTQAVAEKDAAIAALNKNVEELQDKVNDDSNTTALLEEKENTIKENLERIENQQAELEKLEASAKTNSKLINDKDAEIIALKEEITNLNDFQSQLNAKLASQEKIQAAESIKLRQEIEILRKEKADLQKAKSAKRETPSLFFNDEEEYVAPKPKKQKSKAKISAIDYNSDSTDWLMPTPPTTEIPIEFSSDDEPKFDEKQDKESDNKNYTMSLF